MASLSYSDMQQVLMEAFRLYHFPIAVKYLFDDNAIDDFKSNVDEYFTDEFSRESLDVVLDRRLNSDDVLQCLTDLFVVHGPPEHIRLTQFSTSTEATRNQSNLRFIRQRLI